MSRKKTIIINNILFVNNIKSLVAIIGDKYTFAAAIGTSYDAVRQWCIGENLPNGKQLLAIRDKFGVSIDWLLAGTEPTPIKVPGVAEDAAGYNADRKPHHCAGLEEYCPKFKKIILSEHPVIKPAFLANLAAFEYSIDKEKSQDEKISEHSEKIKRMKGRIFDLEEAMTRGQRTGTDAAASSNTGKRET